jgi:hypothetical protein
MRPRTFALTATIVGALFLAAAYAPDAGLGFVKDDAPWIETAVEAIHHPASAFAVDSSGFFFRPLVTASFAADYALHGSTARGYGLTNLLLCFACAGAIALLFRALGLSAVAIATGLLAWALNPHGIAMSVLWISGRTSLLMALCSTLAIFAFLRRQRAVGAALFLAALFAKEDAVAVPLIALACAYAANRLNRREALRALAWMAGALAVYFVLRLRTSAMTPATAPWYYRLLTSPWAIGINGLSYLDRGGTSAAILTLLVFAVYRVEPAPLSRQVRLFAVAVLWFAAGLAITVRIPVRSDLYAVFPSIGAALACAAFVDACRSSLPAERLRPRDGLLAVLFVLLLLLVPIYRDRNARFAEPARVSGLTQERLRADLGSLPEHGTIVFQDTPAKFSTFGDAFDGMATSSVRLFTGRPFTADIVMPPETVSPADEAARYGLRDGAVVRLR